MIKNYFRKISFAGNNDHRQTGHSLLHAAVLKCNVLIW